MKILAISDVPSKALWDYNTREKLEGIDLILSCGDLPKKYLESSPLSSTLLRKQRRLAAR